MAVTTGRTITAAYTWANFPGSWDSADYAAKPIEEAGVVSFALGVTESAAFTEEQNVRAVFGLYLSEAFGISEAHLRQMSIGILHSVVFSESLQSNSNLGIRANESISIGEQLGNTISKRLTETLLTTDALSNMITSAQAEGFAVGEDYQRQVDFVTAWAEALIVSCGLANTVKVSKQEATQILDYFIRNANGVVGDISFFNSAYTETQFQAQVEAAPTGFTEFVPFLAGEHSFGEAIFKTTMSAASTLTRPRMNNLVVAVDVPDVTDQGLMSIQTTGTSVVFAKSFFKVPSIKAVIKAGGQLAIPRITNETTLGFDVKLESISSPGTFVAGVISWSAEGY